jgi:hypothetical protein
MMEFVAIDNLTETLRDAARYLLQNGQTKQGFAVQACVTMLEDDGPANDGNSSVRELAHHLHYAAYSCGFEYGKVGQHVDSTIAANKANAALRALLDGMDEAIAAERDRCAAICESVNNHDNPMTAKDCADAIRAGNKAMECAGCGHTMTEHDALLHCPEQGRVIGLDAKTGWIRLADSDWVNIVNAPSVLDPMKDKEEAVREAVKLTEARLKQLNVGGTQA